MEHLFFIHFFFINFFRLRFVINEKVLSESSSQFCLTRMCDMNEKFPYYFHDNGKKELATILKYTEC